MNIVKIGGGKTIAIEQILRDIKTLGEPTIIVHGANHWRDQLAAKLQYDLHRVVSEKGHSSVYSDEGLMDIQIMSYAGLCNKRIVEKAQTLGLNAIGLTGIDGGLVLARRNRGIRVNENGRRRLVHDLSGKPQRINRPLLEYLLTEGYLPVLTIPFLDEGGRAVNSENDDLVVLLHKELRSRHIFFCIEAPGLMRNDSQPPILLSSLSPEALDRELERSTGRFKRKLHALKQLSLTGPAEFYLCDGRTEHPLIQALEGAGTCMRI